MYYWIMPGGKLQVLCEDLQVLYENLQVLIGFRIPLWTNQIAVFVTHGRLVIVLTTPPVPTPVSIMVNDVPSGWSMTNPGVQSHDNLRC